MVHQVPLEVVFEIISLSDTPTLLSFCLAAKSTHSEAVKQLYRHIDDLGEDDVAHFHLLITLTKNPNLAALVRSYASEKVARSSRRDVFDADPVRNWRFSGLCVLIK